MMEVAPGPLLRTHTAPTHGRAMNPPRSNPLIPPRGHTSLRAPYPQAPPAPSTLPELPISRPATADQLAKEAPITPHPGAVMASDNIINQVADSSKSLYQICVKLRQRLAEVPGFQPHLDEMEREEAEDPMTAMWRCLKKGYPLLTVYNALNPAAPIEIDPSKVPEAKRPKDAAFKFSEACKTHLKFPPDECFLIKDLHGDDTTGFVKVISAVNKVLDMLQERNLLIHSEVENSPTAPEKNRKKTHRDYIIEELVGTERKYVQDLESLQQFKLGVEEKGEVTGDKIHAIFLNLNALLDFQRRFLIRIETTNSLPEEQQNWGQIFIQSQDSFRVYEPYIANQQYADEQAMLEFDKLQRVGHGITSDRATLSGFLMKPFQRLSKYPLLLKELRDKCEAEDHIKEDLSAGIVAATSILERANAAIDREQRLLAVEELQNQVEDWRGHNPRQFGELLLYGTFTVVKADGRNDDQKKDYKIYLFERILLCCKEFNPNKQKGNLINLNRPTADRKSKPKMLLKGRIFMQNVTETLSLQKPGSYTVQIFWKGDPGVENFVIRFNNEEIMKKWYTQVEIQRKTFSDSRRAGHGGSRTGSTSDTEFAWSKNQGVPMQNPYKQEDDAEDDDDGSQQGTNQVAQSTFSISRNASNASLRSRPATGDSGPAMPPMGTRIPPPRFPMGHVPSPALTLHTQIPSAGPSPAERAGASYFSPTGDSPVSTRANSSSGMHPFPRQNTPVSNWQGEEPHRFTAPAMSRNVSRDAPSTNNGYLTSSRTATRPSLPVMSSQSGAQAAFVQNRLRSASSPDIHNHGVPGRRPPTADSSQPPIPDLPVPPFPHHAAVKKLPVNRSHNNSPMDMNYGMMPLRSATQSPNLQREHLAQTSYTSHPQQYNHDAMLSPTSVAPPPGFGTTETRMLSPPLTSPPGNDRLPTPTQLKVKVSFEDNYVTLVVGTNISYQSLVDRIDAKLSRFTTMAIGKGTIRLRYVDEDGDQVTIRSDEDIQIAFSDWKEQQRSQLMQGQLGEIHLFCQKIDG